MSVVCGPMFGEERVNNSVDLLSRVLVSFSVGQISALVAVILISLREDFVYNCHTSTRARRHGYAALRNIFGLFMGRTVTHFCCNLLLQTLECHRTCSHARLACFLFETNQHFVGSACVAGLCLVSVIYALLKCTFPRMSAWFLCVDIDECADGMVCMYGTAQCGPRSTTCYNLIPGYQCTCKDGYTAIQNEKYKCQGMEQETLKACSAT